jgi:hypothetical protein
MSFEISWGKEQKSYNLFAGKKNTHIMGFAVQYRGGTPMLSMLSIPQV